MKKKSILNGGITLFFLFLTTFLTAFLYSSTNFQTNINFSDSMIIINGSNKIALFSTNQDIQGIPITIDWDQIPDFGIPNNEVQTITILDKKAILSNNYIITTPKTWRFQASNWTFDVEQYIPYLEKLEFLPEDYALQVSTSNIIPLEQNSNRYFINDTETRASGLYPALQNNMENTVSSIHLIPSVSNQYIYAYKNIFDTVVSNHPTEELTTTSNNDIVLEQITDTTNMTNSLQISNTVIQSIEKTETTCKKDSTNNNLTSVDKKNIE